MLDRILSKTIQYKIYLILFILFFTNSVFADNQKKISIIGNENIDKEIIYSIIENKLTDYSINNLNEIIKTLYETGNFKNIESEFLENEIILKFEENPSINNIRFTGNKRFKKDQIFEIFDRNKYFHTLNNFYINNFINDLKNLYSSYGYNLVKIEYQTIDNDESDQLIDIIFNIEEGTLSKIKKIYFIGNDSFNDSQLRSIIKSKQQNFFKLFSNVNYKQYQIKDDIRRLKSFYNNSGFKNVNIEIQSEFNTKNNTLNVFFYIIEGEKFLFRNIEIDTNDLNLNDTEVINLIVNEVDIINNKLTKSDSYNPRLIEKSKYRISNILNKNGIKFFEYDLFERIEETNVDIIIKIFDIQPKYVNKINIFGNTRTKEKVIRRELSFAEGDAINDDLIRSSKISLEKLGFFQKVQIKQKEINNQIDVEINVQEVSTGEFQVGLALDSFSGATFLTGLKEKNILGDGRELNLSINTSANNTEYLFGIVEPYIFNKDVDFIFDISYREKDVTDSSSYDLSQFRNNVGFKYALTEDVFHSITLEYLLKDYTITKTSASDSIKSLAGTNADILLNNSFFYNNLDSYIRPSEGSSIRFYNTLSPVTDDNNGYVKNFLTFSKYYTINSNVISSQTRLGNITSLQNKEISVDDKFSLGGRWLRGFDSYGVGPRESRSSYVGGKSLFVTKLDFQRPIFKNSDNPVDFDLFFDVGTVFDNKVDPSNSSESIRASTGFGLKFYSPIGPIGFSWGFPIAKEEYDIERMFIFSIGNLN